MRPKRTRDELRLFLFQKPLETSGCRLSGHADLQLHRWRLRNDRFETQHSFAMMASRWCAFPSQRRVMLAIRDECRRFGHVIVQSLGMGFQRYFKFPIFGFIREISRSDHNFYFPFIACLRHKDWLCRIAGRNHPGSNDQNYLQHFLCSRVALTTLGTIYRMPATLNARPSQNSSIWYCATRVSMPVTPSMGKMLTR